VETPDGVAEMSQLQVADLVLTFNSRSGQFQFSPIIMWLDKDEVGQELFVELRTKSNRVIRITSSHLIYVSDEPADLSKINEPEQPLTLSTGNKDNNQENYYYYETHNQTTQTTNKDESSQILTHVPNATSVNQMLNEPTNANKPPLAIEDLAFTTYARNVVPGQYLLVKSNKPYEQEAQSTGDVTTDQMMEWDFTSNSQQTNDGTMRSNNRLAFENKDEEKSEAPNAKPSSQHDTVVDFDRIVSIRYVSGIGIYAPLTREGNIVVNSVVASCYAVISDHDLGHLSFAPVRWLSYVNEWIFGLRSNPPLSQRARDVVKSLRSPESQGADDQMKPGDNHQTNERRIHWYPSMLYSIAKFILPTRYLY